jgi:hypothetical protein
VRAYDAAGFRWTMAVMDAHPPLKRKLPHPYNLDLSTVLRRLNRQTQIGRNRLANDPVTAGYLAAAMRLIQRHLGPDPDRTPIDPEGEGSLQRPLLSFLSQRAVADEVNNNPKPFPRRGSVPTMRDRWSSQSDFIADLLHFGLWSRYHLTFAYAEEAADHIEELTDGPDFVKAVHSLGFNDLVDLIENPRFRLKLIAAAAAEGDDVIREAMAEGYRGLLEPWKEVCAQALQARGLQLRRGITLDDFANLLIAIGEGVGMRILADPDVKLIDHGQGRSLLGTGGLALILGCVERAEDADGRTLEQAVHAMAYHRRDLSRRALTPRWLVRLRRRLRRQPPRIR